MNCPELYAIQKSDLKKAAEMLAESFFNDPLYVHLLPDEKLRSKILPGYFNCYLEMCFPFTNMLSESPELGGIITVFDSRDRAPHRSYRLSVAKCVLKVGWLLWRADPSGKAIRSFLAFRECLSSKWERKLEVGESVHIDLLAVSPQFQGRGIAKRLMSSVLERVDGRGISAVLETHNGGNVPLYRRFGFELFEMTAAKGNLKQYCMVR
ncbi:MAG: N-acetyltransferase [Oscillospiraceae bacterium]|nr:N-acetyltransferase [Oscillospiraceae bacterium]